MCKVKLCFFSFPGDIKQFTAKGVIFEGEDEEISVDEVVLATGYKIYFPYLSKDIVWVEDNKVELFKFAFPPKLKHNSLVLIGLGQPVGPLMPISELQSRVYALHMSGKCTGRLLIWMTSSLLT